MEDENEYYFESEQLALKNNTDYHNLMKYIVILQAQKTQAIQDIDTLKNLEAKILKDPEPYLQKLQNGEDIGAPRQQIIPEMPVINWEKYAKHLPAKQMEMEEEEATTTEPDAHKPGNVNRLWTIEEQKRLEELLVKYPSEPVEMRRFAKIAKALGNRTTKQVCSRVQKYFIKLHKAGLPIPGRIPKTVYRRGFSHRHQRHNRFLYRPSTFFPDNAVPVHMSEFDDDVPGAHSFDSTPHSDKTLTHGQKMAKKIELLRKITSEKELGNSYCIHGNYTCNECKTKPIVGTRWNCTDCSNEVNLCTDCFEKQINLDAVHALGHKFVSVRYSEDNIKIEEEILVKPEPRSVYDEDYFLDSFAENNEKYNYLDPNFLPE